MSNQVDPSAVDVAVTNWSPGAYGIWGVFLLQAVAAIGAVIKWGPTWLDSWAKGRRMNAEDERLEAADVAAREATAAATAAAAAKELTDRMAKMEDRLARMSNALGLIMSASTTTINALEAVEPEHPAIRQSRELLGLAASALGGDDPFNKALQRLALVD